MDWSWATEGVTDEVPRTTGPECINYMTNRRRWIETVLFTCLFIYIIRWAVKRLDPIIIPKNIEHYERHTAMRLFLLLAMTLIFGIEVGFKFAGKSVIFIMNPCHIQTMVQIYLLASKPSKTTIALFRIQMNNLNGPFLAFLFPEVECRTLPFEQATYWIQHALLYIIPVYILKTGAYKIEDISDYNWVTIGVMVMLLYHFVVLNALSIYTGINLNHMLCAAVADPFQGQNYRIAAVIHESILCPILNKVTVLLFCDDYNHKFKRLPLLQQPACNNQNVKHNNKLLQQQQQPQHVYQNESNIKSSDAVSGYRGMAMTTMQSCNLTEKSTITTTTTATSTPTMLYHQKQLTPTEQQLSLAAELSAALAATSPNAQQTTTQILKHRRPHYQEEQQQQQYHNDMLLYDFENVDNVDDEDDDIGDVIDDVNDDDACSTTAALDREVELLLMQQRQQQQQQADSDINLALEMGMHSNKRTCSSNSNNINADYSTMPTTKID